MNSPRTFVDRRLAPSGFTIIELILVIAIGIFVVSLAVPTGVSFFQSVIASDQTDEIAAALRQASRSAALGKNNIPHGVKFNATSLTVFQGPSYALRQPEVDQTILLVAGVTIQGAPSEIVFTPQSGSPSATGTITVGLYGKTNTISLDERGLVYVP